MKTNTKKMVLNALLLSIGLILRQLTPAIGLPIQPDLSLVMLFTIMIINKGDYKTSLICGIICGIFAGLTTKFPGGQVPLLIDKFITVNLVYVLMNIIYKMKIVKKLEEKTQDMIVSIIILPLGTLISGTTFLVSALILVGLPGSFKALFLVAVAPAVLVNLICGVFFFKIVVMSVNRLGYKNLSSLNKN
ncbi:MAG: tryptophan transporter [Peptostreptococcaceae bacterium]